MEHKERVIIYSSPPRLFRTTYIGYLYEISQVYPTILVSEKLDTESEKAIGNKALFPKLEKIIHIDQYAGKGRSLWHSHKYFNKVACDIISKFKPKFIITDSSINSFEKYLLRYGRLNGAINVAFQAGFQNQTLEEESLRQHLLWRDNGDNVKHSLFTRELKLNILKLQEHVNEILDYWIFPLLLGTYPFFHKSLFKYGTYSWVREFDYTVFFSEKEAKLERSLGRRAEGIKILSHPLQRKSRYFFEKAFDISPFNHKRNKKGLTIMLNSDTFGHQREDLSLIPQEKYISGKISVINLILKILPSYKIYLKPHPVSDRKYFQSLNKLYGQIPLVTITDPFEPADKYIEKSSVVVGFPPPSTTLYTATLQNGYRAVIYVDLHHELLGDAFKCCSDIEYIDSMKDLKDILTRIKSNKYSKIINIKPNTDTANAVDILEKIS